MDASQSRAARGRRILFATIAAGGSHVSTAHAMAEAVEAHFPGRYDLRVVEPMTEYGFARLDAAHKDGWRRMLARPRTIVWGQRLIDAWPRATVATHRLLLRGFAARAAHELSADPPDLIVANHGWLTVAFTLAQRRYGLRVPVLTFETSTLNANALWADQEAERFVVGSAVSRARLARLGIPKDRVDVVGYPVRRAFLEPPEQRAARAELGLADRFTCLVSLGGEGVGDAAERVVHALLAHLPDVQIVVVCGRNRSLARRLERLGSGDRLRLLGYVAQMARLTAASDLVIAKTGPATVYETLAVGRPLLAPARYGEAENKMIALLERLGAGEFAPPPTELVRAVRRYRGSPELLELVRARARALDFAGMAERLARYIAHYADTGAPLPSACGRGLDLPA